MKYMGRSPLLLAIERDDCVEVARLLDKGVNVNFLEYPRLSPLHIAVEKGNSKIVELLLKKNAYVNAIYGDVSKPIVPHPLLLAAMSGCLDVITLLIAYGAFLTPRSRLGLLPIHIAAQKGYFNVVKYFVENELYHVDTTCSKFIRTPLIWAAIEGHTEIVEYLIECNADFKIADKHGRTSLHQACQKNHIDIIEILIREGFNLDVKTYGGTTPLHICVSRGYLCAARRLIESGARSYLEVDVTDKSPIYLAVQCNRQEILEYFFKMGISVNFQTKDGYSLLHAAVNFGRSQMVTFLLQNGANIEGKIISRGTTALHLASLYNKYNVIKVLLNKGADVMAIDNKGRRPLDLVYEDFDSYELRRRMHCGTDILVSTEILVKHMLLFYNDIEMSTPSNFPGGTSIDDFKQKCQEEIAGMKTCLIEHTTVSLYIFLQALLNKKKLLIFLRNHELQEELKNIKEYIDKYPIYSSLLPMVLDEVHNGMQRLLLLEKAGTAMDIIVPNLVFECKINILQMLSNKDLSSLIESVKVEFY